MHYRLYHYFPAPTAVQPFDTGEHKYEFCPPFVGRCYIQSNRIHFCVYYTQDEAPEVIDIMMRRLPDKSLTVEAEQEVASRIYRESTRITKRIFERFVQVAYNYIGRLAPKYEFGSLKIELSADGKQWSGYPPVCVIAPELLFGELAVPAQGFVEYVNWFFKADREPHLGLTLLGQANYLLPDRPRAALTMSVAALELGVKATVAEIIPGATWLLEESPSPPVVDMITKLLPTLITSKYPVPPGATISELRRAVSRRNELVHKPSTSDPSAQEAYSFIRTIQDTFGIIQYARGYEYVKFHIRQTTQTEYQVESVCRHIASIDSLAEKEKGKLKGSVRQASKQSSPEESRRAAQTIYGFKKHLTQHFYDLLEPICSPSFHEAWDEIGKQTQNKGDPPRGE